MRRGIKLVMSAATLVVVGVAMRASAQPHSSAAVVSSAPAGRSRHAPTRPTPLPPNRSGTRTAPPSRPSPTDDDSDRPTPSATRPSPSATRPSASPTRPSPSKASSVTVAGDLVQTQYGPVQVEITMRSGRITQARALARPSGDGQTDSINSYAIPQLIQETLAAQSARIDTVSGATFTSGGYQQSLQSALDAAHRAGA